MHGNLLRSQLTATDAYAIAEEIRLPTLMREAARLRDEGHGRIITYSRKVFIPLTNLCRNSCHYCTFARSPRASAKIFLTPEDVAGIVARGEAAGCTEALFMLGDKPELRYEAAQLQLGKFGYTSTVEYLRDIAGSVIKKSSLLPHLNAGVVTPVDMITLRLVSASMGLMLETSAERLSRRGGVHFGSPDKIPVARLQCIRAAGELAIPFTTGLLIGIGETRRERIESILALRNLHDAYGHLQEIIVQPFRAKTGTRMAGSPSVPADDLLWTIAVARLIFGPEMNIQTPPNLSPDLISQVIDAGINDWGGISPITADFVNPEAPWPQVEILRRQMEAIGCTLAQRLPIYPAYARDLDRWVDSEVRGAILRVSDSQQFARDCTWTVGGSAEPPSRICSSAGPRPTNFDRILLSACAGNELLEEEIVRLFEARDGAFEDICYAADELRARQCGDTIHYVVNRNINYTNVCSYRCAFCAFSKGKKAAHLRGPAYDLDAGEIMRRVREAWGRGATEVCMQGGIHPNYTGQTYLALVRVVKDAVADMHVHAFSPLEIRQGAQTLGIAAGHFLARLRDAGLGSLPGTAAEILDDGVRSIICPDKLTTTEWLSIVEDAHRVGLRSTATIMFGHVERPVHWARHLLTIRRLQEKTGGFTEFVPLPFVHMETPIYAKGRARRGPTWREAVLMHAVARLTLHPLIPNIQTSWVKMGLEGAKACLNAGANDLGGTLMNESISRAAGGSHGQELPPSAMDNLIGSIGRIPAQRSSMYQSPPDAQRRASYPRSPLMPVIQTLAVHRARDADYPRAAATRC